MSCSNRLEFNLQSFSQSYVGYVGVQHSDPQEPRLGVLDGGLILVPPEGDGRRIWRLAAVAEPDDAAGLDVAEPLVAAHHEVVNLVKVSLIGLLSSDKMSFCKL